MSSKLKRVNYSIYLNPVNSLSDRYAVGIMQKWVNERKDMLDNPDDGLNLHNSLHMHKNIYLSGMFLHLLSPTLSAGLANSLGDDSIKMATLKQQLDACGLVVPMAPTQESGISREDLDSLRAAVDMTPLLGEIQSLRGELQQASEHQRQASEAHQHQLLQAAEREQALLQGQQNTQQELVETRQTLMSLCSELAESVAANIASADEIFAPEPVAPDPAASEAVAPAAVDPEVATPNDAVVTADFSELQQALTEEIRANNHKREIAELKALIKAQSQLIKTLSLNGTAEQAKAQPEEEADLTTTIASMQKVKKKGLW
ncbi:hypothetical protein [Photobacterium sp. OFAV2-7]|uniref:hypothetical protein n=1 Tax=Photobacterium sp. OFAV2-7 TaxID=2917748 RepID=UPI001EF6C4E6|nr:hypothetical protein [Photobacterium sp. OFAV2-7]MCG7584068.1 hypothetical protein [Photobacterium sp. OFAV2-7]